MKVPFLTERHGPQLCVPEPPVRNGWGPSESLAVATRTEAMKPSDLARIVVDTTVQPKAVMFPTDAKLLNRARERLVRLAKKVGVELRPIGASASSP